MTFSKQNRWLSSISDYIGIRQPAIDFLSIFDVIFNDLSLVYFFTGFSRVTITAVKRFRSRARITLPQSTDDGTYLRRTIQPEDVNTNTYP